MRKIRKSGPVPRIKKGMTDEQVARTTTVSQLSIA